MGLEVFNRDKGVSKLDVIDILTELHLPDYVSNGTSSIFIVNRHCRPYLDRPLINCADPKREAPSLSGGFTVMSVGPPGNIMDIETLTIFIENSYSRSEETT